MKFQYLLGLALFLVSFNLSANCITGYPIGYVSDIKQTHYKLFVHRFNNIMAIHRCRNNRQKSCQIIQVGNRQQLCRAEKGASRVQAAFKSIVSGIITGGSSQAADLALKLMIQQARMKVDCPATQVLDQLSRMENTDNQFLTYFEVAHSRGFIPGLRRPSSELPIDEKLQKAKDYFSDSIVWDFATDQRYSQLVSPFQSNFFVTGDLDVVNNYCRIFR